MNHRSIRFAFVIVALALGGAVIVGDLVREARERRPNETRDPRMVGLYIIPENYLYHFPVAFE